MELEASALENFVVIPFNLASHSRVTWAPSITSTQFDRETHDENPSGFECMEYTFYDLRHMRNVNVA